MNYKDFAAEWDSPGATIECHTSGSTGRPSKICLTKEAMLTSARRTVDFFGLDKDSWLHSCISPDFIGGKMMLVRQRFTGCSLTWETPTNQPLNNLDFRCHISLVSVVPSQMWYILEHLDEGPEVDAYLVGGSPVPPSLVKAIQEAGLNVYESYGMTETASHVALRKVEWPEKPFHLLPGVKAWAEPDTHALHILADGLGEIITNDAAVFEGGDSFRILGRLDNVIISGGKKIHPEEIEKHLTRDAGAKIALCGVADPKWGERLVCYAECRDEEIFGELEQKLRDAADRYLESWQRPKEYRMISQLPLTPTGKVKRSELRKL